MKNGGPSAEDKKAVSDYYRVLNVILTAGVVMEIMLVPPVIDRKQGESDCGTASYFLKELYC